MIHRRNRSGSRLLFPLQNPPLELTLDTSETGEGDDNEIEVSSDGIWSVVGGKVSGFELERQVFVSRVHLLVVHGT